MGWDPGAVGLNPVLLKRSPGSYRACGIAGVLLAGALAFQFLLKSAGRTEALGGQSSIQLARRLPSVLPGWRMKEIPLGPNEFLQQQSAEILRCDEFVFREFFRGDATLAVFSTYWGPGKMPARLVALHTPDRCWTENGWVCREQAYDVVTESTSWRLLPAQWRLFNPPQSGQKVYVLFWLINEGKPYNFGRRLNRIPNPFHWWLDVIDDARSGSKEHLFIRLTSDRPFEELQGDPGWEELLEALANLGLMDN